jgi:hypothetical protein
MGKYLFNYLRSKSNNYNYVDINNLKKTIEYINLNKITIIDHCIKNGANIKKVKKYINDSFLNGKIIINNYYKNIIKLKNKLLSYILKNNLPKIKYIVMKLHLKHNLQTDDICNYVILNLNDRYPEIMSLISEFGLIFKLFLEYRKIDVHTLETLGIARTNDNDENVITSYILRHFKYRI